MKQRWIGFFEVLSSGACFGFLGYFGKKAYESSILPGEFLALRFLISMILLGLILVSIKGRDLKIPFKSILQNLILGICGYAIFSSFYFYTLTGVSSSLTVLLLYTYPVFVTLGSKLFFKEEIGKLGILALILSCIGMMGLVWGEWSVSSPLFLITGFGSAIFYAAYILLSFGWLKHQDPYVSTFYIQMGAALVLNSIYFKTVQRPLEILGRHFGLIFMVAFVSSILAMSLLLSGLKKISSSEASILSTTEPLMAILIATLFLGERLLPIQVAGGILVLMSVILISRRKITSI